MGPASTEGCESRQKVVYVHQGLRLHYGLEYYQSEAHRMTAAAIADLNGVMMDGDPELTDYPPTADAERSTERPCRVY